MPDVEAQRRPTEVRREQGQNLDVEGTLSATFRTPSPLSSVNLTVRYKSEQPLYPDLGNLAKSLAHLPPVPDCDPDSDDSFHSIPEPFPEPSAPLMEDFGNDMSSNNEAQNIGDEVRPASADSGIQSDQPDTSEASSTAVPGTSSRTRRFDDSASFSSVPVTSSNPVPGTSSTRAGGLVPRDAAESDIDPSDHEEGELSESESAAEDDAEAAHSLAARPQAAVVVPQDAALPATAVPIVPQPGPSVARARGRRGRGQRGRGRPRRRQARKRPWDLSDGSVSSEDEEASFPTRISPRKKPYQGYRY